MKRRHHTPEQIIRKLREAERLIAEGKEIAEVAKTLEVSEATFHRWRNQYGGMKADDVRRLKDLERENASLKRIVANKELEIDALKEIARGRMKVKSASAPPRLLDAAGAANQRRCVRRRLAQPGRWRARAGGVPHGWARRDSGSRAVVARRPSVQPCAPSWP